MPTYQTSPSAPWIFPDQAYQMNSFGMKPLRAIPLHNNMDLFPGGGSEAQTFFESHEHKVVLDRLRNNARKEKGMLGQLKTNERSQRYERPMSRSAVHNGVFPGSEYVTSAGLRGGVISTKEGQEWLQKRLKQRAQEYSDLASGNFSAGPPSKIEMSPFGNIDTLLQIAFTSFTSGTFSSGLNDTLNQLLQALIKAGSSINENQLARYSQAIEKMIITARSYDRSNLEMAARELGGELDVKRYQKLAAVQQTLRVIDAAVREIARVINEPISAREQVMSALATRLLNRQLETFNPAEQGFEEEGTAPLEMGQRPGPSRDIMSGEQFQPSAGMGKLRRMRRY